MPLSLLFWILLLLYAIFGAYVGFRPGGDRWSGGGSFLLLLILLVLGMHSFGAPIQGH